MRLMLVAAALTVLVPMGCAREESLALAPVSGTVTLDGQPLADATVHFEPQQSQAGSQAPSSFGKTDERGQYHLEIVTTGETGAMIGQHRVTVTVASDEEVADAGDAGDAAAPKERERRIPLRYNRNSDLTFEVPPGGSDSADFALQGD